MAPYICKYTCIVPVLIFHCSDYQRNLTDVTTEFESAPLGPGVKNALWQLSLALIFKATITIFTFGIKVSILEIVVHGPNNTFS